MNKLLCLYGTSFNSINHQPYTHLVIVSIYASTYKHVVTTGVF